MKHKKPFVENQRKAFDTMSCSATELSTCMALGGTEASSLAAASSVAGTSSNFVAGIARAIIATTGTTEPTKQSRQIESREVEQMTTGTTANIVASGIARIAITDFATRITICNYVAGIAITDIATTISETSEQIPKQEEPLTSIAVAGICTRIAICNFVAGIAIVEISARIANLCRKQITQTFA